MDLIEAKIEARKRFQAIVTQPEAEINLAEAALCIAWEEYPNLKIGTYLTQLDEMAQGIAAQLPSERYPLRTVQTINQYLFETLGFTGNQQDYYDPRNSFLNEVLDRRTGIPILLSLVYLEVAARLHFPMVGVNMPGHFLIQPDLSEIEFWVDPFHHGEILFAEDCRDRLSQIYGQSVALQPEFFDRSTPIKFLARMLTNLKFIYLQKGDLHRSLGTIERLLILHPDEISQRRDRGLIYYRLGNWLDARSDLHSYLDAAPQAEDAAIVAQLLELMNG